MVGCPDFKLQTPDLQNPESQTYQPGPSTLLRIRSSVLSSNPMRTSGQVNPTRTLYGVDWWRSSVSDCFQPSRCDHPASLILCSANLPLFSSLTSWLRSHRPCWSVCHSGPWSRCLSVVKLNQLRRTSRPNVRVSTCDYAIAQT